MTNSLFKDRFISVNGLKVRYWDEGEGPQTILCIHGVGASVDHWSIIIPSLAQKARVIAVDLVGFGLTDKPKARYTHAYFQAFLENFVSALHLKSIILVGHSMGGGVVIEFAANHPELVTQLVLVSSAGFSFQIPFSYKVVSLPWFARIFLHTRSKRMFGLIMKRFLYKKEAMTDQLIIAAQRCFQAKGAKRALYSTFKEHVNLRGIKRSILHLIKDKVAELKMPVTIIWGAQDRLLNIASAYRAKELIPHAKLHIFSDCGHVPQLEQPEQFIQVFDKLLKEGQ